MIETRSLIKQSLMRRWLKRFSKNDGDSKVVDRSSQAPPAEHMPTANATTTLASLNHLQPSTDNILPKVSTLPCRVRGALDEAKQHYAAYLTQPVSTPETTHYQEVGSLLAELPDQRGKLWDLPLSLISEKTALQWEVEDCLHHCDLPKKVVCSYYMRSDHRKRAWATILIWSGDTESRKRAKSALTAEVLIMPSFTNWRILLAAWNPALPHIKALTENTKIPLGSPKQSIRLWRDSHRDAAIVECSGRPYDIPEYTSKLINIKSNTMLEDEEARATSTIVGVFTLGGEDLLLTCAHVFTDKTPFSGLNQSTDTTLFDEDDSDDDYETAWEVGSYKAFVPQSGHNKGHEPKSATSAEGPSWPKNDGGGRCHMQPGILPMGWSDQDIKLWLGAPELDYALITLPPLLPFPFNGTFFWDEWYISDDDQPPYSTRVHVKCPGRPRLSGSLLLTDIRINQSSYWTYWPEKPERPQNRIMPGDSGAIVYDARSVYGHVIAGCPNGAGIIVPSSRLVRDITRQTNQLPVLFNAERRDAREARRVSLMDDLVADQRLRSTDASGRLLTLSPAEDKIAVDRTGGYTDGMRHDTVLSAVESEMAADHAGEHIDQLEHGSAPSKLQPLSSIAGLQGPIKSISKREDTTHEKSLAYRKPSYDQAGAR